MFGMSEKGFDLLKQQEGYREFPYADTMGNITIGYGFCIKAGISEACASALLDEQVYELEEALTDYLWYSDLDRVRKDVIDNMAFNMGVGNVLQFDNMIACLEKGDYAGAAKNMLESKWAEQVGPRAIRLAQIMSTGTYEVTT